MGGSPKTRTTASPTFAKHNSPGTQAMVCPDVRGHVGSKVGGAAHWGCDLALTPSEADHSGKQTRTDESKKQHIYLGL